MSDLLGRLARRAAADATPSRGELPPTIAPRLAGRFEPREPSDGAPLAAIDDRPTEPPTEPPTEHRTVAPTARGVGAATPTPDRPVPPAGAPAPSAQDPGDAAPPFGPVVAPTRAHVVEPTLGVDVDSIDEPAGDAPGGERVTTPDAAAGSAHVTTPGLAPRHAPPAALDVGTTETRQVEHAGETGRSRLSGPTRGSAATTTTVGLTPPILRPAPISPAPSPARPRPAARRRPTDAATPRRVETRIEWSSREPLAPLGLEPVRDVEVLDIDGVDDATSSGGTVHVHVDRLEVHRPAPPPAPTPDRRPRATAETLGLDQYLAERRERGGRR